MMNGLLLLESARVADRERARDAALSVDDALGAGNRAHATGRLGRAWAKLRAQGSIETPPAANQRRLTPLDGTEPW